MLPAALLRQRAELEQTGAEASVFTLPAPQTEPEADSAIALEATRLGALAAEFGLFGMHIALDLEAFWDASAPYRTEHAPETPPANDAHSAPAQTFAFPEMPARGLHIHQRMPARAAQVLDWIVVLVAAELAALWGAGAGLLQLSIGQAGAFVVTALMLKVGLWLTESYRFTPASIRPERSVGGLTLGAIAGIIMANLIAPDARAAAALATTLPIAAMVLAGVHAAFAVWVAAAHRKGVFAETIVLIGATDAAARLAQRASRSGEARIIAVVEDRLSRAPAQIGDAPVAGNIDDLLAWEGLPNVDRIIITVTQKAEARVRTLIQRLRVMPNRVDLLLDYQTSSVQGRRVERINGAAVACVSGRPHNHRRALIKRGQDIVIGAGLLALFALPMLAIAVAVKLDSRGPVLYRQRRHGFNNRIITVLKFRSMQHAPDAPLRQVQANDTRVTKLGAFLRRTSLDELPQLFNVLRGDMSLVGPRPHAVGMKAAERDLQNIVAEYAHRHRVKPGLTGWAQVNGSRGPIETPAEVRRRLRLDLEYVSNASLWLDLQILVRTAPTILGDTKVTR
jgi:Undecaprenyl-phosphate glucose phosphotransferase